MKRRTGFTLTELLVVIAVMMVVMGMLVINLAQLSRNQKVRSSEEAVVNTIALARSMAISDNAIYHVRVENAGKDNQWIGVYRFPRVTDALSAGHDLSVQAMPGPGWNLGATPGAYTNVLVRKVGLEQGVVFETQYNPALLWDEVKGAPKPLAVLHPPSPAVQDLYYSGKGVTAGPNNPFPALEPDEENLLPKPSPTFSGVSPGSIAPAKPGHVLLYFMPDGTASANVLLFIRDDRKLFYVQVWRGGLILSGDITTLKDFERLN